MVLRGVFIRTLGIINDIYTYTVGAQGDTSTHLTRHSSLTLFSVCHSQPVPRSNSTGGAQARTDRRRRRLDARAATAAADWLRRPARSLELGPSTRRRRRVRRGACRSACGRGRGVVLERGGTGAEQQCGEEDDGEAEGAERRDEDEGAEALEEDDGARREGQATGGGRERGGQHGRRDEGEGGAEAAAAVGDGHRDVHRVVGGEAHHHRRTHRLDHVERPARCTW